MNIRTDILSKAIAGFVVHHQKLLPKTPPEKLIELKGFIAGLEYVNRWIIPALENCEQEEIDALVSSMTNEIEDLKSAHLFGMDEPT